MAGTYVDGSVTAPSSLNKTKVEEELATVIATTKWTVEPTAQFMLVTAPGSKYETPVFPRGCAYHAITASKVIYDFVPYQGDAPLSTSHCIVEGNPSGNPVYKTSKSASHEYGEAATDPEPRASSMSWRAGVEEEVADLCQSEADLELPSGAWVQNLYDDNQNRCSHEDASPPHAFAISEAATEATEASARLHATINAEGIATKSRFQYGTTETYGSSTTEQSAGSGVNNTFASQAISGLTPSTTYHFRALATNSTGTTYGADQTFTTGEPGSPTVESKAATAVGVTVATVNGNVNPHGNETKVHFEYGTTKALGTSTPDINAGSGTTYIAEPTTISGLQPGTGYYFRIAATSSKPTVYGKTLKLSTHRWSLQVIPSPEGGEIASGPTLEGITRASSTSCETVGWYTSGISGLPVTLAESWNGSEWHRQTTPAPPTGNGIELKGVACSSSTSCVAVGTSQTSLGSWSSLVEGWNGTEWSIKTSPNPEGAIAAELLSVDCASSSVCIATGRFENSASQWLTLSENWNGTEWKLQTTPNPTGSSDSELRAVSCGSSASCASTGIQTPEGGEGNQSALSETWNGKAWTIRATPAPPAEGEESSFTGSLPCWRLLRLREVCTAAGGYVNKGSGNSGVLIEAWNGTEWTLQAAPQPETGTKAHLHGVSCPSSKACWATGSYEAAGKVVSMAEAYNGSEWLTQPTPNPEGASLARLMGVSCPTATLCVTTGSYKGSTEAEHALAEKYN